MDYSNEEIWKILSHDKEQLKKNREILARANVKIGLGEIRSEKELHEFMKENGYVDDNEIIARLKHYQEQMK